MRIGEVMDIQQVDVIFGMRVVVPGYRLCPVVPSSSVVHVQIKARATVHITPERCADLLKRVAATLSGIDVKVFRIFAPVEHQTNLSLVQIGAERQRDCLAGLGVGPVHDHCDGLLVVADHIGLEMNCRRERNLQG